MDRSIEQYFSKEQTNCIKGLLALAVVAGHARNFMTSLNDTIPGMIFTAVGYLAVASFFFFSGYGLEAQRERQGARYLREFLSKRLLPLYVVYAVAESFYALYYSVLNSNLAVLLGLPQTLAGLSLINIYDWFFQAILLCYILYYLGRRFAPKEMEPAALMLGLGIYSLMSYRLWDGNLYCQSILGFPAGILLYHFRVGFDRISTGRRYWGVLAAVFAVFSVTLLVGNLCLGPVWVYFPAKLLSSVLFPLLVLLLVKKVPISCGVTRWLGKRFSEIYIAQGVPLSLLRSEYVFIQNDWLYLLACLAMTIGIAAVFHPALQWIQGSVRRLAGKSV